MATTEPASIFFNLDLFCTETSLTSSGTISFPDFPKKVLSIKEKVEDQFSIPVCVQTLSYESHILSNDTMNLELSRIRSGDKFVVKYSSEGDCKGIDEIISWFGVVRNHLLGEDPSISHPLSETFKDVLMLRKRHIQNMAFGYLIPWLDARTRVNKLYFVHCGGLDVVLDVYEAILANQWENCTIRLKYLESGIISILWNLAELMELRRQIVSHKNNGLRLCMKSLMRQKLEEGNTIEDPTKEAFHRTSMLLVRTMEGALGLLCNLNGLPECHTQVAYDTACLEQLTCLSVCPSVHSTYSLQLVATLFTRISHNPLTHPFLAKPVLVGRLLAACKRNDIDNVEVPDTLLLRYFTQVFLAQVILASPQCIPMEFKQHIQDFMDSFLKTASYQIVREREMRQGYEWFTFLTRIGLLYLPDTSVLTGDEVLRRLHVLSLQTVLLSLQNMLGRDNHRQVLLEEGLEDYITCVPEYVPAALKGQAEELVQIVRCGVQVRPPRLINLVRAKLSKMHLGLQKIIFMTVGEIVTATLTSYNS